MDVRQNIEDGKYKNKFLYDVAGPTGLVAIDKENMTGKQVREAEESNKSIKRAHRDKYHAETAELMRQFAADLAEQEGLTNHPKVGKLYSLAWEHGHSSGLADVVHYYEEFAELMR